MAEDLNLVNTLNYGDNLFIVREYIAYAYLDLVYFNPRSLDISNGMYSFRHLRLGPGGFHSFAGLGLPAF